MDVRQKAIDTPKPWSFRSLCRAVLVTIVALTAVLVVMFGCFAAYLWWIDPLDDLAFSQDAWHQAPTKTRAKMAHDLISNHLRMGMKKDEVLTLLGEPDEVRPALHDLKTDNPDTAERVGYALGYLSDRGYYDSTLVYVTISSSGIVTDIEIDGY